MILGFGATVMLLGRYLFKRFGEKPAIGYIFYPIAFPIAAALIFSPLSSFLMHLKPFFPRGSFAECIMLAFYKIIPAILLIVFWRSNLRSGEYP
jgi:predicted PurR-regulated permease PerM